MYKKMVFVMLVLAAFSMFAACRVVDASQLVPQGPQAHMGNAAFKESSINVKKGQMLVLVDDVAVQHIIVNGYWKGSQQIAQKEPGAPAVNASITGGSKAVGPFTTAGKFSLYCTIHGGMQITVMVS